MKGFRLLVFVGFALLLVARVSASGLLVAPVVIEMDLPRRAAAIRVTNGGDAPITLQTSTSTWKQVDGQDRDEPSDDLLVVPSIAEVAPGATQIFRLALRVPAPAPTERTYHLTLDDITEKKASEDDGAQVFIKVTHKLPVMVAPSGGIRSSIQWKRCANSVSVPSGTELTGRGDVAEACVRLRNSGNRRVRVESMTVLGDGWQQNLKLNAGVNMLAGADREWRVPLTSGQVGLPLGVEVLTGRGEVLRAEPAEF